MKKCLQCDKWFNGFGKRKYCGSISRKQGCAYEEYINRKEPLKKKIKFSDRNYQWRIDNLIRTDYHCENCKVKGRQRTVLDFPDLPVLYVDRLKPFDDIIKDNKITTVEEAEMCSELWDVSGGKVLCVSCYDKAHKTSLRKTEKKLLKIINAKRQPA